MPYPSDLTYLSFWADNAVKKLTHTDICTGLWSHSLWTNISGFKFRYTRTVALLVMAKKLAYKSCGHYKAFAFLQQLPIAFCVIQQNPVSCRGTSRTVAKKQFIIYENKALVFSLVSFLSPAPSAAVSWSKKSEPPAYTEVSKGIILLQTENINPLHT